MVYDCMHVDNVCTMGFVQAVLCTHPPINGYTQFSQGDDEGTYAELLQLATVPGDEEEPQPPEDPCEEVLPMCVYRCYTPHTLYTTPSTRHVVAVL